MEQDVNKIIENVGMEWAGALAAAHRKIAIIAEENRLLVEELEKLKKKSKPPAKQRALINLKGVGSM